MVDLTKLLKIKKGIEILESRLERTRPENIGEGNKKKMYEHE